ncbi:MAG: ABC transporter ATP-binding protein, partial [Deltaproteobacteria bacterium]|nr:ABC transporter ATP-binding protein [Deltaproteobacteria bacterium]
MSANEAAPLTNRDGLRIIGRALRFLGPVKREMVVKILFTIVSLVPILFLPWPAKILIDHVIEGRAFDAATARYPFFIAPIVAWTEGGSPVEIAAIVFFVFAVLLALVGAWSMTGRDQTYASLAQGMDVATRSENEANSGWSFAGGIFGYIEFRWTLRLSHLINHHYRSELFERIQRMPMTSLDDQRIGDAVYRVMYDTPSITETCYRLVLTPAVAPLQIAAMIWVLSLSYGHEPIIVWTALAALPTTLIITLPFSSAVRRSSERARETGGRTTTTIEEGIANVLAVQSLGGQAREKKRFDEDSWRSYGEFRVLAVIWVSVITLAALAAGGLGLFVFYTLTDGIFEGRLTVGDMWVIIAYYAGIVTASTSLGRLWIYLQGNVAGMRRVFETMDVPEDLQPDSPVRPSGPVDHFAFEGVGFSYPDGTPALEDVS